MKKPQKLRIDQELSREFSRGQNLNFIMYLPNYVPEGHYDGWTPTAQLRKLHNPTEEGFIADLEVTWTDEKRIALQFRFDDTSEWPLGPAEFDVVLTSPSGEKVRTLPVRFTIVPGVTR